MGLFCPKCGSLLKSLKKDNINVISCSCGYTEKGTEEIQITEKGKPKGKEEELAIVEKEEEVYPIVKANCPKCRHKEAYTWSVQTRSADEPETKFFKCTKCKHTWREYD